MGSQIGARQQTTQTTKVHTKRSRHKKNEWPSQGSIHQGEQKKRDKRRARSGCGILGVAKSKMVLFGPTVHASLLLASIVGQACRPHPEDDGD
jgi:hypothetical protein